MSERDGVEGVLGFFGGWEGFIGEGGESIISEGVEGCVGEEGDGWSN